MEKLRKIILILFIGVVIVSCGDAKPILTATATVIETLSPIPVLPSSSLTIQPATLTPMPSVEPLPAMKSQCVNGVGSPQGLDLQGVIVLKQPDPEIDFQAADESGQWPDLEIGFTFLTPLIIKS